MPGKRPVSQGLLRDYRKTDGPKRSTSVVSAFYLAFSSSISRFIDRRPVTTPPYGCAAKDKTVGLLVVALNSGEPSGFHPLVFDYSHAGAEAVAELISW
jgi:hypothetical protein